ncbi:sensor histidine kinase [Altererythrobacter fulvus]|uniref:sensor histidine kinase n=1 Tax=Caenibius fulvus TaxID=2126012 RepID=UPI0030170EE5
MIGKLFENRSSRVIAAGRIALALLFVLWVWLDPEQPERGGRWCYILLAAYLAFAVAVFHIAWVDWWRDYRLTVPFFLIDIGLFMAALYCTEGGSADFVSGYFAFFVFMTISAALRWNWRATLATAAALSLLYLAMGLFLHWDELAGILARYIRRASYMLVLSLLVTWFTLQRAAPMVAKFSPAPAAQAMSPFDAALIYVVGASGATGAAIAWESVEEPGATLHTAGALAGGVRHLPPGMLDLGADIAPTLFDCLHKRMLRLLPGGRFEAERNATGPELARHLGLSQGLCFPIVGTTGVGQVVLTGIPGLCRDHLELCRALAREIGHGIDEEEIASLAREAAANRLRGNIARDLHDSVAQSLAGAGFRLASLKRRAKEGKDISPELEAVSLSLRDEQAHIREIIERLRSDEVNPGTRNLGTELARLTGALSRHWDVSVRFEDSVEALVIPAWLAFEIQQLVRESVANAIRHGAARRLLVRTARKGGAIMLTVADDGKGFPAGDETRMPRSLAERVDALGGTIRVASMKGDTRIEIELPVGGRK